MRPKRRAILINLHGVRLQNIEIFDTFLPSTASETSSVSDDFLCNFV